jgi:peptide/nickel transport system permease protein
MQRYIVYRLGQSIIALIGVSILVFVLTRASGNVLDFILPLEASPEDYARVSKEWGLDKPITGQYVTYMWKLLQGDFGESWKWGTGALDVVLEKFPATLQLAGFTLAISSVMGVAFGVLVATKRDTGFDHIGKVIALLGQSLPTFWTGIVLMWIFAVMLDWLPTSGKGGFKHMILPGVTLGWYNVAALMRLTRSAMLEVLDDEYVKLARIKGLPEWKVVMKYPVRIAINPFISTAGWQLPQLFSGSLIVAQVLSLPTMGPMLLRSLVSQDMFLAGSIVLILSGLTIIGTLLSDVLLAAVDPRIRMGGA